MKISIKIDNKEYAWDATEVIAPIPNPTPVGKYVMLNCINWNATGLNSLPISSTSECTYFVLPVSSAGVLLGTNATLETKFVSDVHAQGKKATFSIAGGAQSTADITNAVVTNRTAFINNIFNHMNQYGFDGVTVDIENTSINSQVMADFINALRLKLGPDKIIGMYTQPYQLNTVMAKLDLCADSLTWLSAMIYDYPNTVAELKTATLAWLPRVKGNKSKLLVGVAVNYNTTGLDLNEFTQVLDWVNTEGLRGIGIWENTLYNQQYRDVAKVKFPVIL